MIDQLIQNLYDYNTWANVRILETAAQLDPDKISEAAGVSFSTVFGNLIHIMSAQLTWLARWQESSPAEIFDTGNFSDLHSLRTRWDQIESETHDFVRRCSEADLARIISYENLQGGTLGLSPVATNAASG